LDLHFPRASLKLGGLSAEGLRALARQEHLKAMGADSQFRGVFHSREAGTWGAGLWLKQRRYNVTGFSTEKEAAIAYDRMVLYYKPRSPQRNFPKQKLEPASEGELRRALEAERPFPPMRKEPGQSGYFGVWNNPITPERPWTALITPKPGATGPRQRYLGCYESPEEAAVAHDRAVLFYYGPNHPHLNYPELDGLEPADSETLAAESFITAKQKRTSQFRGVHLYDGVWYATISVDGVRHWLGQFSNEVDAALAWDEAALRHRKRKAKLNFHPDTGELMMGLSLEAFDRRKRRAELPAKPAPKRRPRRA
jgi:hypothetical protein